MTARVEALRARLLDLDVPALLVTSLSNVRYLCGFTGSAGELVVTPDTLTFVTDGRYREQAAAEIAAAGVEADVRIVSGPSGEAVRDATGACERVGLEAASLSWAKAEALREALGAELVPTKDVVEGLRACKDSGEVDAIRRATDVADAALSEVLAAWDPARTEVGLALALEWAMRTRGASGTSFDSIVAAGPHGALPHARPGDDAIGEGRPVVIDYGCIVDGYCSDTTRTVCWGAVEAEFVEVYDVVSAAQDAARDAVAPGVACRDVDAAARGVISDAGYGEQFVHSTGHGVGIDVHELPRLAATSDDVLAAGNVVTLEPGIYLPGAGGVRIEDVVVVTDAGCETLTGAPREFRVRPAPGRGPRLSS